MSLVLTDDWWATSEGLVEMAEEAAGVDLAPKARRALVEMSVELIVLLTCWPGAARPADALAYLRTRRARMIAYAPWLYALPPERAAAARRHGLPALGAHLRRRWTMRRRSVAPRLAQGARGLEIPPRGGRMLGARARPAANGRRSRRGSFLLHTHHVPEGSQRSPPRPLSGRATTVGLWRRFRTWNWGRSSRLGRALCRQAKGQETRYGY